MPIVSQNVLCLLLRVREGDVKGSMGRDNVSVLASDTDSVLPQSLLWSQENALTLKRDKYWGGGWRRSVQMLGEESQ